jgi:hypothetical protein
MGARPMVKPMIDLMLLSSMFHFVSGMILAGVLANLGSLNNRSSALPSGGSDHLLSDDGWGLIREMFE